MEAIFDVIVQQVLKGLPLGAVVLQVAGSLAVLGTAYVQSTKTLDDDHWLAKIEDNFIAGAVLRALVRASWVQRTPPTNG